MIDRRFLVKTVLFTMFFTMAIFFGSLLWGADAQAVDIRVSSQNAAEKARLKRCRIYTDKYNTATDKLDKLLLDQSKIREKRAHVELGYKKAQRAADKSFEHLKVEKAWVAKYKVKLRQKSYMDPKRKYRLRVLKSAEKKVKKYGQDFMGFSEKESNYGRELDGLKAKEAKLDSQIKQQRRLRDKYKKLMAKNKCGKIARDKGRILEEFEGGD